MKKLVRIFSFILAVSLLTACSTITQSSSSKLESIPASSSVQSSSSESGSASEAIVPFIATSSNEVENDTASLQPVVIGKATYGVDVELVASIESGHEGLASIDIIFDEYMGYSLYLTFEPMDWDSFDNEKRFEIAKNAVEYSYSVITEYEDITGSPDTFSGYAGFSDKDECIFFTSASGFLLLMNTDGTNVYNTNTWV